MTHKEFKLALEALKSYAENDPLLLQLYQGLCHMAKEAKYHSELPEDCDYNIASKFLSMYGRDHLPKRVTYGEGGEELIKGIGGQYYLKLQTEPSPLAPDKIFYYFSEDGKLMANDGVMLIPIEE